MLDPWVFVTLKGTIKTHNLRIEKKKLTAFDLNRLICLGVRSRDEPPFIRLPSSYS